jgi:hypothetical protein
MAISLPCSPRSLSKACCECLLRLSDKPRVMVLPLSARQVMHNLDRRANARAIRAREPLPTFCWALVPPKLSTISAHKAQTRHLSRTGPRQSHSRFDNALTGGTHDRYGHEAYQAYRTRACRILCRIAVESSTPSRVLDGSH